MIREAYAQTVNIGDQFGFGHIKSLGQGVGYLIPPVFSFAALFVIFYFLWGVFRIITAGSDKEAVSKARNTITHAIIGLVLLIVMFVLLRYLPEALELTGYSLIQ